MNNFWVVNEVTKIYTCIIVRSSLKKEKLRDLVFNVYPT